MTADQLHDAILADPTSKALADAGNDAGAAVAIAPKLPPILVSTYVNERGVFAAFSNPADAEAVMQGLQAVAAGNPQGSPPVPPNTVMQRVLKWMEPTNGGIDLSNPAVRTMLDQMQAAGVLTAQAVATLKEVPQQPQSIAAIDVAHAWARYRPDGKVK